MTSKFIDIFQNQLIVNAVIAWLTAQVFKIFTYSIKNKKIELIHFLEDGGMPSAHSATVTALATTSAILYGFGSAEFAITAVLAVIVMHDAMGVRLESGRQAHVINEIVENVNSLIENLKNEPIDSNVEKLKELIGHTPIQVFFGLLLGLAIGIIFS
ncbi:MAG: divergent PAP2 family protein [Bacteroidales bacterium]|nr:divergent PAP2 family protein [Bacteroidales bacterium]